MNCYVCDVLLQFGCDLGRELMVGKSRCNESHLSYVGLHPDTKFCDYPQVRGTK